MNESQATFVNGRNESTHIRYDATTEIDHEVLTSNPIFRKCLPHLKAHFHHFVFFAARQEHNFGAFQFRKTSNQVFEAIIVRVFVHQN